MAQLTRPVSGAGKESDTRMVSRCHGSWVCYQNSCFRRGWLPVIADSLGTVILCSFLPPFPSCWFHAQAFSQVMTKRVTTLNFRCSSCKCSNSSRERPSSHPFQLRPWLCLSLAWLKSYDHPSTNDLDPEETGWLSLVWPESHGIGPTQTLGQRKEEGQSPRGHLGAGWGGVGWLLSEGVCARETLTMHRG